jgi:hypothetical protein
MHGIGLACATGILNLLRIGFHVATWLRRIAGGVLLTIVVAAIVLAIRLSFAPIDMDRLRPYVESALQPSDGSYAVSIGKTQIAWEGWRDGVRVRASEIRFTKPDGSGLASVPAVTVRVGIGAIIRGEIALKELTLKNPQIRLIRGEDGRFELGLVQRERNASPLISGLLHALSRDWRERDRGPLAELESIRVDGGDLIVKDANFGREWQARRVDGRLTRHSGGIDARLSFELAADSNRSVKFSAFGQHHRADGALTLTLDFRDLAPSLFAAARGPMRALAWFDTPFGGRIELAMSDTGRVDSARFDIKGTRGTLRIPDYYDNPLLIAEFSLAGSLSEYGRKLDIEMFKIKSEGPTITTAGTFVGDEDAWNYSGSFALSAFPASDIGKYWPNGLKPSTRKWAMTNVTSGRVEHLDLRLALRKRPDKLEPLLVDKVSGNYRFRAATVHYVKHLPPLTNVAGYATFDEKDVRFRVESGDTESIKLTGGRVDILGFEKPREDVEIVANIEGKLADILRVLDRKPLGFATAVGVSPSAVSANTKASIRAAFQLHNDVALDDIDIRADAELSKLVWRKGLFGLDLKDGRFRLAVDKSSLVLAGEGRLGDDTASVKWSESFVASAAQRRTLDLKTRFKVDTLAALGFDLRSGMSGSFGANLKITGGDDGRTTIDGIYDFREAGFITPGLRIEKPLGVPATGSSVVELHNQRVIAVPRFQLDSPAIHASGSMSFYPDGNTVRTMELTRLVAPQTNLRASIKGEKDGRKTVRIDGASLDLAPLLKPAADHGKVAAFRATAQLGRAYLGPDRFISDLSGDIMFDGQRWRRLVLDGKVGSGAPVTARLVETSAGRWLGISSKDAGAALRVLDVSDAITGGEVDIRASIDDRNPEAWFSGAAQLRHFRMLKAPGASRPVTPTSTESFSFPQAGMDFTEATLPFRFREGVFDLTNGSIKSGQLAITLNGRVDTLRDVADIQGTISPLHFRLFAARFSLTGNLTRPQFQLNPGAGLSPGNSGRNAEKSGQTTNSGPHNRPPQNFGTPPRPAPAPAQPERSYDRLEIR